MSFFGIVVFESGNRIVVPAHRLLTHKTNRMIILLWREPECVFLFPLTYAAGADAFLLIQYVQLGYVYGKSYKR